MMKAMVCGMMVLTFLSGAEVLYAQGHDHDATDSGGKPGSTFQDPSLPPGEEGALAALNSSPRHGEWVDVKVPGMEGSLRTWVVYPERKDKAPAILVICEIYGLTDWIRGVADQLAREGFIAVAPDMVSGKGTDGGGTESATSRDQVVGWVRSLERDDVVTRLNAVRAYAVGLPASNGKTGSIGFCWGGSQSFLYACVQPGLNAAVVYYGTSPDSSSLANAGAPVLGLYGGDDARVNATIEPAQKVMKSLKKTYEVEVYNGAGHGFLRAQSGRDGANLKATEKAWPRTIDFLRKHTE